MSDPSHHSQESWEVTRIKLFLAGNIYGIPRLPGIFPLLIRKKTPKAEVFPAGKSFNQWHPRIPDQIYVDNNNGQLFNTC
jgi:hypothetical protein